MNYKRSEFLSVPESVTFIVFNQQTHTHTGHSCNSAIYSTTASTSPSTIDIILNFREQNGLTLFSLRSSRSLPVHHSARPFYFLTAFCCCTFQTTIYTKIYIDLNINISSLLGQFMVRLGNSASNARPFLRALSSQPNTIYLNSLERFKRLLLLDRLPEPQYPTISTLGRCSGTARTWPTGTPVDFPFQIRPFDSKFRCAANILPVHHNRSKERPSQTSITKYPSLSPVCPHHPRSTVLSNILQCNCIEMKLHSSGWFSITLYFRWINSIDRSKRYRASLALDVGYRTCNHRL